MGLGRFLSSLRNTGRVTVSRAAGVSQEDAASELVAMDAAVRLEGPSELPPHDPPAAMWAAERLYAACTMHVFRDLGIDEIKRRLGVACPSDRLSAGTHLAVDLVLRHLPELMRMIRGVAAGDPLLQALHRLCCEWPLSSVGVPGVADFDISPVWDDAGLRRLYVDRILETCDVSRANDARVRRAIAAAAGEHGCLVPRLLIALETDLEAPAR